MRKPTSLGLGLYLCLCLYLCVGPRFGQAWGGKRSANSEYESPESQGKQQSSSFEQGEQVSLGGRISGELRAEHSPSGSQSDDLPAHKGASQSQEISGGAGAGGNKEQDGIKALISPAKDKGDLAPMYKLSELAQLIFSPFELVRKISDVFKLPQNKLIDKIGGGLVFGAEALLTPFVASLKIIEKVFVPDNCRLKLICQIGQKFGFIKDTITKFSPHILYTTQHVKALSDGVNGRSCELVYKSCEPKLKKPFEDLKGTSASASASSSSSSSGNLSSQSQIQ